MIRCYADEQWKQLEEKVKTNSKEEIIELASRGPSGSQSSSRRAGVRRGLGILAVLEDELGPA